MEETLSSSGWVPLTGRAGAERALSSAARAASESMVLLRASSICASSAGAHNEKAGRSQRR